MSDKNQQNLNRLFKQTENYYFHNNPKFEEILRKLSSKTQKRKKHNPEEFKDKTRSRLAFYFIIGMFVIIVLSFVLIYLHNKDVIKALSRNPELNIEFLKVKDVIFPIMNAFGPTLGFIIGFFFKESSENRK